MICMKQISDEAGTFVGSEIGLFVDQFGEIEGTLIDFDDIRIKIRNRNGQVVWFDWKYIIAVRTNKC